MTQAKRKAHEVRLQMLETRCVCRNTFELAWGEVSPEQNRDLHLVKVKVAGGEVSPEQKRTVIDIL